MSKRFVTTTILFICLIAVASAVANAQGRDRIEVNIPFCFVLKERMFPAGKYVVERSDPGRPNIMTVTNVDKHMVRIILMQRVENNNPSTASSLVFLKREGKLYLFQVWNVGAMNGTQVPLIIFDSENIDR